GRGGPGRAGDQIAMVVTVQLDLMAPPQRLDDDVGVAPHLRAEHEERCLPAEMIKAVKDRGGPEGMRPIVEGDGHLARGHRTAQAWCEGSPQRRKPGPGRADLRGERD